VLFAGRSLYLVPDGVAARHPWKIAKRITLSRFGQNLGRFQRFQRRRWENQGVGAISFNELRSSENVDQIAAALME
jgi:hypothetical protein